MQGAPADAVAWTLAPVRSRVAAGAGIGSAGLWGGVDDDDEDEDDLLLVEATALPPCARSVRVRWVDVLGRPPGEPAEAAFVAFVTRRPGLSLEAFWEHWIERHVPLVLGAGAQLSSYELGRVVHSSFPCDGVVRQGFASGDALAAHHLRGEPAPHIAADARRFVGGATAYVASPHP